MPRAPRCSRMMAPARATPSLSYDPESVSTRRPSRSTMASYWPASQPSSAASVALSVIGTLLPSGCVARVWSWFGQAFQVRDDVLDLLATQREVGHRRVGRGQPAAQFVLGAQTIPEQGGQRRAGVRPMPLVIDDMAAGAPLLRQLAADLGIALRARRERRTEHDHRS